MGAVLVVEGGEVTGTGAKPFAAPTLASVPASLQFYVRGEAQGASFVLELPQPAELKGRLYDAAGREVARLADGAREAGVHSFAVGAGTPSGIYFGRMIVTSAGERRILMSKIAVVD
jgi:hypothetical protein